MCGEYYGDLLGVVDFDLLQIIKYCWSTSLGVDARINDDPPAAAQMHGDRLTVPRTKERYL
jgi:hypothetical protein